MSEAPATQYEFSGAENQVFTRLAWWMHLTGGALLTVGLLQLMLTGLVVFDVQDHPVLGERWARAAVGAQVGSGLLIAVVFTCLAYWTRQSARSLRNVVRTQGHDIDHVMRAVAHLRASFTAMFYALIASLLTIFLWTCFGSTLSALLP